MAGSQHPAHSFGNVSINDVILGESCYEQLGCQAVARAEEKISSDSSPGY